jgi:hypothetical protein
MKNTLLMLSCALALSLPSPAVAQSGSGQASAKAMEAKAAEVRAAQTKVDEAVATTTKIADAQFNPRFVRTLTNVQIELTITDQIGTAAPDKKTVSMIVSSGNWGKIRSAGSIRPSADPAYGVEMNVDARPYVSVDGPVQLELTVVYSPPNVDRESSRNRPSGINQSQTLVLTSGKAMVVSQAADPVSDRKVTIEAKATVLK